MGIRVDDYFPYGCGDRIREKDGRHVAIVRAVYNNRLLVTFEDTGWKAEFECDEVEPEHKLGPFLNCEV